MDVVYAFGLNTGRIKNIIHHSFTIPTKRGGTSTGHV